MKRVKSTFTYCFIYLQFASVHVIIVDIIVVIITTTAPTTNIINTIMSSSSSGSIHFGKVFSSIASPSFICTYSQRDFYICL